MSLSGEAFPKAIIGLVAALFALACNPLFADGRSAASAAKNSQLANGSLIYKSLRSNGGKIVASLSSGGHSSDQQFACQKCHGRSGLGTIEGNYVVPPIAGKLLTGQKNDQSRTGYTKTSFFKAITAGVNSKGKILDPLMPKFVISEQDAADLFEYLANLPLASPQSVDLNSIHFATVVSDKLPDAEKEAIISVMKKFFDEKNRQTRLEKLRPNRGTTPESQLHTLYRDWKIDIWTVKGDSDNWEQQLKAYYAKQPVFALIGGKVDSDWTPVANFCEKNSLPCLFPSTYLPAQSESNDYSFYFNRGLGLDAALALSHLKRKGFHTFQLAYCDSDPEILRKIVLQKANVLQIKTKALSFHCDHPERNKNRKIDNQLPLILWSEKSVLSTLIPAAKTQLRYYSDALLGGQELNAKGLQGNHTFLIHSRNLPTKFDSAMRRFTIWAKTRKLTISHPRLQSEAFFACLAASDGISHIRRYLVKNFLVDTLDHAEGLALYLPGYPQPSLGPEQRYLSKGGYIVPVKNGQALYKNAKWLQP